jgi:hypothetical protein
LRVRVPPSVLDMIIRHKRFPVVIIYRDPKDNWDNIVKAKLLEEIRENGFDCFVIESEEEEEAKNENEQEEKT